MRHCICVFLCQALIAQLFLVFKALVKVCKYKTTMLSKFRIWTVKTDLACSSWCPVSFKDVSDNARLWGNFFWPWWIFVIAVLWIATATHQHVNTVLLSWCLVQTTFLSSFTQNFHFHSLSENQHCLFILTFIIYAAHLQSLQCEFRLTVYLFLLSCSLADFEEA